MGRAHAARARADWRTRWSRSATLVARRAAPAFPLGYGLSYTSFELSDLKARADDSAVTVEVTVANTGGRRGSTVAQVYGGAENAGEERPTRVLLGFARLELDPGGSARVTLQMPLSPLTRREPRTHRFVLDPGRYALQAARFAGDPEAVTAAVELG